MCESAGLWKRLKENSTGPVCTGRADPQESTGRAGWLAGWPNQQVLARRGICHLGWEPWVLTSRLEGREATDATGLRAKALDLQLGAELCTREVGFPGTPEPQGTPRLHIQRLIGSFQCLVGDESRER